MGCEANVSHFTFPKQGEIGKAVEVLFHYKGPVLRGTIIRDDLEAPFKTIIKLDDGRYILGTECQYSPGI